MKYDINIDWREYFKNQYKLERKIEAINKLTSKPEFDRAVNHILETYPNQIFVVLTMWDDNCYQFSTNNSIKVIKLSHGLDSFIIIHHNLIIYIVSAQNRFSYWLNHLSNYHRGPFTADELFAELELETSYINQLKLIIQQLDKLPIIEFKFYELSQIKWII